MLLISILLIFGNAVYVFLQFNNAFNAMGSYYFRLFLNDPLTPRAIFNAYWINLGLIVIGFLGTAVTAIFLIISRRNHPVASRHHSHIGKKMSEH